MISKNNPLVSLRNVVLKYRNVGGTCCALNGVSLDVYKGETFGLIGESGSGKSSLGKVLLCLEKFSSGQYLFDGIDLYSLSDKEIFPYRRLIRIVFQDPFSSVNPQHSVKTILTELLVIHGIGIAEEKNEAAKSVLKLVGLNERFLSKYLHELSGGQCQRVCIARALICDPTFLICDEPLSALDMSIQAQVINLLIDLRNKLPITFFIISHDLSVVRFLCDRVGVMYRGMLVETGSKECVFNNPLHPHTKLLFDSEPSFNVSSSENSSNTRFIRSFPRFVEPLKGIDTSVGCPFAHKCSFVHDKCFVESPKPICVGGDHYVSCHLFDV